MWQKHFYIDHVDQYYSKDFENKWQKYVNKQNFYQF
jgi:hypothetical protein